MTLKKAIEKYKKSKNNENLHLKLRKDVFYVDEESFLLDKQNKRITLSEKELNSKSWIVVDF